MTKGWSFPVRVDPRTGRIQTNDLSADIRESIHILLETRQGERVGRPDYGSSADRYMFETISRALIADIRHDISQWVSFWEKRIDSLNVDVVEDEDDDGRLIAHIRYRVIETEETDELNYIFPLNDPY